MEPRIIYKDRHILVIDKPGGMPSVNIPGGNPNTLVSWLLKHFPKQAKLKESGEEAGLIHRLDNETSGIMVAACSYKDYKKLRETWSSKEVTKEYRCLVLGQTSGRGNIRALIAHHPDKRKKMTVTENAEEGKRLKARYAETEYELIESFLDYSYLRTRIWQGLRHQIRCHLAYIGHPIAGDKLYQRTKHKARDRLKLKRHFLHASKVSFIHPSSGKSVEFESPLPTDLTEALQRLK